LLAAKPLSDQGINEMEFPKQPRLQFLHSENALNSVKLAQFLPLSTEVIESSLHPGQAVL
jgi:hypothetical protein